MLSKEKFHELFRCQKCGPSQNYFELQNVLTYIENHFKEEQGPKVILEIGTFHGGTLRFWRELVSKDGLVISLDLNDRGFISEVQEEYKDDQRVKFIIADSTALTTPDKVQEVLGERTADILFIDGAHDFMSVTSDVDSYSKFVHSGGLVILHDIIGSGPKQKWETIFRCPIKSYTGMVTFFGEINPCGIGVLVRK